MIIYKIINENSYWKGVRHIYSPTSVSKYELYKMISDIYELNITVKELKTQIPSDIANKIDARIQSIAKKLSGDQNEEFFVWVEKISDKNKILNKLVIHVLKYDYNKIIEEFNDSILTLTPKAWGLVSTDKVPLVVADTSGKLLNITPAFVRNSSKDGKTIDIPLDIKIDKSPEQIRTEVPDQFFSALDSVYSSIFK
jgi:hypothetical protein